METINRIKDLALIILVTLISFTASAQTEGIRIGILGGVGKAKVDNEDFQNQSGKIALGGGVALVGQLTRNIGIYGNVLFISKGTKSTGTELFSGGSGQINYSYWKGLSFYAIEVPLMPKISFVFNRFHVKFFAGPSINFNVHTNEEKLYDDISFNLEHGYNDLEVDVPVMEYAVVWGAGLDVEVSDKDMMFVEIRKHEDLNMNAINIVNNNHYYNEYYLISLGYLYKF